MADAVHCKGCQRHLPEEARRRPGISISAQGDERSLSWWWCEGCGVYTRKEYVDRFHGEPDIYFYGPFRKEVGDADLARVAKCANAGDKWCECEVHKHFGGD